MKSQASKFKIINRGFKETLVLIPGWATDYRIFNKLDIKYNYIIPVEFSPLDFNKGFSGFLEKASVDKVSLFGWSMGGFLAAEFAASNSGRVNEVILLNICKSYEPCLLLEIKSKLKRNKKAYLYKFYQDCFSQDDQEALIWFRKYLMQRYLQDMRLEDLISVLDYLSHSQIKPEPLAEIKKIRIFHGEEDRIAPLKQARDLGLSLKQADFQCIKGAGHISFLSRRFPDAFYNGYTFPTCQVGNGF